MLAELILLYYSKFILYKKRVKVMLQISKRKNIHTMLFAKLKIFFT